MPDAPVRSDSADKPPTARGGWFGPALRGTLGTVLVGIVLGAAALPWWLSHPDRLSRIIARAAPGIHGDVSFEGVRLSWVGPMVLEGLTITPRAGGEPPITAARVEVSHGLLAVLLSVGDLGQIAIDGLRVDLALDEEHHSNLEQLFPREAAEPESRPTGPRQSPIRLRLDVEEAVVRITAPWTTEPWVSEPISVRAALRPVPEGWSEWVVEPAQILTEATMAPPVAWGVLAYAAPVLADTTRAAGRFSLKLDGARLPVGDPRSGTFSGVLSMHEVVVGPGPLAMNLINSLPIQLPAPPAIRVADQSNVAFRLADRRIWHEGLEFGLPLPGEGRRLDVNSQGSVGLDDQSLDIRLMLPIPADLRQDRPLLAALAGKTISVGVAGKLGDPQIVFDGSIKQAAGQVAADLIDRIRNGPSATVPGSGPVPAQAPPPGAGAPPAPPRPNPPTAAGQPLEGGDPAQPVAEGQPPSTAETIVDIVGGVLDEVARRRAEREANGEVPPPRRGRLRQRLQRPGVQPAPQAEPPLVPVQPPATVVPPPPAPQPPTR